MKRIFDFVSALIGLLLIAPLLLFVMFLVWLHDRKSPIYVSERIGLDAKPFKMYKLRTMIVGADQVGGSSTSNNDTRITKVGSFIRKFKLDELSQLLNVILGDMSLVGPRPNVMKNGVELYTEKEMQLLTVRPGITDLSSIVFSDEGTILKDSKDPDGDYNKLIRPWKSKLGLLYIDRSSLFLDYYLIILTLCSLFSKKIALKKVCELLRSWGEENELISVCERNAPLRESTPPGVLPLTR